MLFILYTFQGSLSFFICDVATKYQSEYIENDFYEIENFEISMNVHALYTLHIAGESYKYLLFLVGCLICWVSFLEKCLFLFPYQNNLICVLLSESYSGTFSFRGKVLLLFFCQKKCDFCSSFRESLICSFLSKEESYLHSFAGRIDLL